MSLTLADFVFMVVMFVSLVAQNEPGPGQYDPKITADKPPSQAKKSPGFLSSAQRSDKLATKFFTGNFVSLVDWKLNKKISLQMFVLCAL